MFKESNKCKNVITEVTEFLSPSLTVNKILLTVNLEGLEKSNKPPIKISITVLSLGNRTM